MKESENTPNQLDDNQGRNLLTLAGDVVNEPVVPSCRSQSLIDRTYDTNSTDDISDSSSDQYIN